MATTVLHQISIKINGTALTQEQYDKLLYCTVETALGMPDMCVLMFDDDPHTQTLVTNTAFALGKTVEVSLPAPGKSAGKSPGDSAGDSDTPPVMNVVMKGEIVGLESDFTERTTLGFKVTAYDQAHRLTRNVKYRSFVDVLDSDIVSQVASEAGLATDIEATSGTNRYYLQANISNMALLHELALRNEHILLFHQNKLYFKKQASLGTSSSATLKWGDNLRQFSPRVSGAGQVEQVTVQGWDWATKKAITGVKTTSNDMPSIATNFEPSEAFSSSAFLFSSFSVNSQTQAENVAQKLLNSVRQSLVTAEGVASGDSRLLAGRVVSIENVTTRFSGTYRLTSATHHYSPDGYTVDFSVSGGEEPILADMMQGQLVRETPVYPGVYSAIVMKVNREEGTNAAHVTVKFPWLDDKIESDWVRVVHLGAGSGRGLLLMPEADDEVLVAFEHGDLKRPFVIGGLYNGTDSPPINAATYHADGKIVQRLLKTRAGHQVLLVDKDGQEKIEIVDKSSKLKLTFDTANKKIVIKADDTGGIEMTSSGPIAIKSEQKLTMEGSEIAGEAKTGNLNLTATGGFTAKSTGSAKVEGTGGLDLVSAAAASLKANAAVTVEGQMSTTVQSSGVTVVKGNMVKIN